MSVFQKACMALACLGFALASPAAIAATTTVFSNFGPGNTFDIGSGYSETGPDSIQIFPGITVNATSQGEGFTVPISGALSTINIALSHINGTNDAHLYLADANGIPPPSSGPVPGAILESFTITNLPQYEQAYTPELVTSTVHPFLTSGTTYFLYEAETGNESNTWNVNSIGEAGPHTMPTNGGRYFTSISPSIQGAFSVQVDAVPEASQSASFGLLLILGIGSVIAATSRKKAIYPA